MILSDTFSGVGKTMKCPFCGNIEDKVIDSRKAKNGIVIRRRRECTNCKKRYTTYEYIEKISLMVIKADGRRESFDRKKLKNGILLACTKRPISMEVIDDVVERIEEKVNNNFIREVKSKVIGEYVMEELRKIDEVAYVRFASVYRKFQDKIEFLKELDELKH